jgi:hypothetical protein
MTGNKLTFLNKIRVKKSPLLLFIIENKATLNSKSGLLKLKKHISLKKT